MSVELWSNFSFQYYVVGVSIEIYLLVIMLVGFLPCYFLKQNGKTVVRQTEHV